MSVPLQLSEQAARRLLSLSGFAEADPLTHDALRVDGGWVFAHSASYGEFTFGDNPMGVADNGAMGVAMQGESFEALIRRLMKLPGATLPAGSED